MREKLTASRIAAFHCADKGKPAFLWDTETKGLGIKVSPGGAKRFVLEARLHGKTLRLTIGDTRTWPLDGPAGKQDCARAEARRLMSLIDQGIDPRQLAVEQKNQADAQRAKTKGQTARVSSIWDEYLAYQKEKMQRTTIERGKKWGERHLLDHLRLAQPGGEKRKRGNGVTVAGVLRPLLEMRLVDITATTLREWQRKEAATRANNARQAYEMFRAFWRWCGSRPEYKGLIDIEAVENDDLRDEVPSRKPRASDSLEREQLAAWFAAVRGLSNPVIAAYLQTLLLTGARREEIASLQWENIDFRWNALTIKDKVEGERIIPLTPYVASLLIALPRRNQWVFSSPAAKDGKLAEPRLAHNRALAVAGLPHVSLHGLRRTFASMAEWQAEMPTGVVAQIMGHKPSATAEKHYKRRPLDLLREWHVKYEAWMLKQAGIEFSPAAPVLRMVTNNSKKAIL